MPRYLKKKKSFAAHGRPAPSRSSHAGSDALSITYRIAFRKIRHATREINDRNSLAARTQSAIARE